jgi:hypothetical protein
MVGGFECGQPLTHTVTLGGGDSRYVAKLYRCACDHRVVVTELDLSQAHGQHISAHDA